MSIILHFSTQDYSLVLANMIETDKSSKMMLCTFYYLYILWLKQTYKKIKFELQGLIGKSQKSKMQMKTFHRAQNEKYHFMHHTSPPLPYWTQLFCLTRTD